MPRPKHAAATTKTKKNNAKGGKKNKNVARKASPMRKAGRKAVPKNVKRAERAVVKTKRQARTPKKAVPVPEEPVVDNTKINEIVKHPAFSDYMSKKVGKRAVEVIGSLEAPQTDEKVAEVLGVKVNEVRRMLNVLNSYSVVRYDVNKDSKGWLTFKWYLDREKIVELGESVITKAGQTEYRLPDNCNDFFVCNKCYQEQKIVLPFENAFEMSFKCECGDKLRMISRVEAENLFKQDGRVL